MANIYLFMQALSPMSLNPAGCKKAVVLHKQFRILLAPVQHEMEMVVQQAEGNDAHRAPFLQAVEIAHGNPVHPGDEFLHICK